MKLTDRQCREIEEIYEKLQQEYDRVAKSLNFSCDGCDDNCCDSYFQHHTYVEWCYFREGFDALSEERKEELRKRAEAYLVSCRYAEKRGERPQINCPLLDDGLCTLYKHRLLVCRTHGVPAALMRPDGKRLYFPGCFRCQKVVESQFDDPDKVPFVDRSKLLSRLAQLENNFLKGKRHLMPRLKITIAEMILQKPPELPE